MKANWCTSDSDCNDENHFALDTCDMDTKECRHALSLTKCRTFGNPTALALRLKASDVGTTMSLDQMVQNLWIVRCYFFTQVATEVVFL